MREPPWFGLPWLACEHWLDVESAFGQPNAGLLQRELLMLAGSAAPNDRCSAVTQITLEVFDCLPKCENPQFVSFVLQEAEVREHCTAQSVSLRRCG